jgi:arginine deiminase
MERMTDYKPQERQDLEELYRKQNVRIYELEQENKKLKECNKSQSEVINSVFIPQKKRLEEENEKLKKYYDRDKEELMESCYSLARENDKLKSDLMQDMKEITKLEKENKNLKSDLSECECSF